MEKSASIWNQGELMAVDHPSSQQIKSMAQIKVDGSVVRKKTYQYSGIFSGILAKFIFAYLLQFVSVYGLEVLEGQKFADEVKEILLESELLGCAKLDRKINVLTGVVGVALFFIAFLIVLMYKERLGSFLHLVKKDSSSQTESEVTIGSRLDDETVDERVNDRLSYSPSSIIGIGSNGTIVCNGTYNKTAVAVKRVLHTHYSITDDVVQHLLNANYGKIVRFYSYERDKHFGYMVFEKCGYNLEAFIEESSNSSSSTEKSEFLHLWEANGDPSRKLIEFIKNMVDCLERLHRNNIIHGNLKPSNVLIAVIKDPYFVPKLSDMRMSNCQSSITDYGTSGWKAHELIVNGRYENGRYETSVDMFSLGCLIFFCVTKGNHPFGEPRTRDANIENNRPMLFSIVGMPEVHDLVSKLLHRNPNERLNVKQTLKHPFFWISRDKMEFIALVSDIITSERGNGPLYRLVERVARKVFRRSWLGMISQDIVNYHQGHRWYNYSSLSDLLRLMRNSRSYFQDLSKCVDLCQIVGSPKSEDLYEYYFKAYRSLLIEVYNIICRNHPYNANPEFQRFIEV